MGLSRPGDMGFDIVHFNLHKSFTQPHGGGGPGSGPIAVSDRIAPFLPRPLVVRGEDGSFDLDYGGPKSIGRLRGFHGNYGTFVRAYAYIRSLGGDGLRDASEAAVLNANYLLARLQKMSDPPLKKDPKTGLAVRRVIVGGSGVVTHGASILSMNVRRSGR